MVAHGALDVGRGGGEEGGQGLGGEGAELVLVVAEAVGDERQGALGLPGEQARVLAREAGEEVVEGGEAGVDEGGVRRGGRGAQGVEQVGYGGLGDVVLLDARLDGGDEVDLGVDGRVAAQHRQQMGDLLVRELGVGHCRGRGAPSRVSWRGARVARCVGTAAMASGTAGDARWSEACATGHRET